MVTSFSPFIAMGSELERLTKQKSNVKKPTGKVFILILPKHLKVQINLSLKFAVL